VTHRPQDVFLEPSYQMQQARRTDRIVLIGRTFLGNGFVRRRPNTATTATTANHLISLGALPGQLFGSPSRVQISQRETTQFTSTVPRYLTLAYLQFARASILPPYFDDLATDAW